MSNLTARRTTCFDRHVAEYMAEHPGIPAGVIKQYEFTNRAGYMLNVPAALRLLREKLA